MVVSKLRATRRREKELQKKLLNPQEIEWCRRGGKFLGQEAENICSTDALDRSCMGGEDGPLHPRLVRSLTLDFGQDSQPIIFNLMSSIENSRHVLHTQKFSKYFSCSFFGRGPTNSQDTDPRICTQRNVRIDFVIPSLRSASMSLIAFQVEWMFTVGNRLVLQRLSSSLNPVSWN